MWINLYKGFNTQKITIKTWGELWLLDIICTYSLSVFYQWHDCKPDSIDKLLIAGEACGFLTMSDWILRLN